MLLLLFVGKIRGKDKTSLHYSQGYRYSIEQNRNCCNTARVKLGCSLTSIVLQQSWAIPFDSSMHRKRFLSNVELDQLCPTQMAY